MRPGFPKNNITSTTTINFRAAMGGESNEVDEREFKVMRELEGTPDLTQRELALRVGVSVGAINFCVNALIDKGFVKMHNFAHSKNKLGYVYLLTPKGITQKSLLTKSFLARKLAEYERLKREIEELRVLASADPEVNPATRK